MHRLMGTHNLCPVQATIGVSSVHRNRLAGPSHSTSAITSTATHQPPRERPAGHQVWRADLLTSNEVVGGGGHRDLSS